MSKRLRRLSIRVPEELAEKVRVAGKRDGLSQARVHELALEGFFAFEREDARDAAVIRRLDQISRRLRRLERNDLIVSETLALFLRFLFMVTPKIEGDLEIARNRGEARFQDFLAKLRENIADNRRLLEEAIEEITVGEEDFLTRKEFDALDGWIKETAERRDRGDGHV